VKATQPSHYATNCSGSTAYLEEVYQVGGAAKGPFNPLSPAYNSCSSAEENQRLATKNRPNAQGGKSKNQIF